MVRTPCTLPLDPPLSSTIKQGGLILKTAQGAEKLFVTLIVSEQTLQVIARIKYELDRSRYKPGKILSNAPENR